MGLALQPNQTAGVQPASPAMGSGMGGQGSFLPLLRMLMMSRQGMPQQQGVYGAARFLPPYQTAFNMPPAPQLQLAQRQAPSLFTPYAPATPVPKLPSGWPDPSSLNNWNNMGPPSYTNGFSGAP